MQLSVWWGFKSVRVACWQLL